MKIAALGTEGLPDDEEDDLILQVRYITHPLPISYLISWLDLALRRQLQGLPDDGEDDVSLQGRCISNPLPYHDVLLILAISQQFTTTSDLVITKSDVVLNW